MNWTTLARRLFTRDVESRATSDPNHPRTERVAYTGRTGAGVYMTPDTALTVATVWACVRYLSQTVAVLPWRVMKAGPTGGELAPSHPVDWLINSRPSDEWSAMQFRETLTSWALRHGNGYAEIERDIRGRPFGLWPIHPERVQVCRDPETRKLYYRVTNQQEATVILEPDDVLHIRGFGEGPVGLNVMAYAAESIGWAKAAQLFGAAFFGNSATPSAVVTMKKPMTPEGIKAVEKKLHANFGGPRRANKTVVLDNDMDYKPVQTDPDKAQFLETNQYLVDEVCRWFGVPPHKVMHLLRATFSNIEHQSIEVVVDSVTPWVKRWEEEADWKLFGRQNRIGFYTKMNLNALLRGDSKARSDFYSGLRNIGVLTANDILRLEDMPTIGSEGDKRIVQSAMTTLERVGEDPVATQTGAAGGGDPGPSVDDPNADGNNVATAMTEAESEARDRVLAALGLDTKEVAAHE